MKVIFVLCTLFILCFLILISANQSEELTSQSTPITYDSEEVDCDWLNAEYARIINWNNKNEEVTVTPEGLVMTALTVATLPIRWIGDFLSEDVEYHFSDNPDDIVAVAEKKECYNLLEKINQDRINGTYPSLLRSNQK